MKKEEAVDMLNALITINNDRIEGYETAADASEEQDIKTLFAKLATTSQKCKQELVAEVSALGGEIAEGTKTSGKFFRAWMDVKAALTGKDREAILSSCEFGEDKAQETYEDVMEDSEEHLTPKQQAMLVDQKSRLKADHDHVRSLRDALKEA